MIINMDKIETSNSEIFSDNNIDNPRTIDIDKREMDEMNKKIENIASSKKSTDDSNGKIQEGFESNDGIARFRPEDWTGVDNINDEGDGEAEDFRQIIVDLINYIYEYILYVEKLVAYEITKLLSRGEFKDEDVDVVKKYVTWFFSICATCFIVYNWFYVMFYRNSIDQKPKVPEFSRRKAKEIANTNMYFNLVEPYITFSLFFPEYLQKIFTEIIPNFIADHFNPTLQFTGLFYLIIYVLYNFSNSFRQLFIDIVMMNTSNWLICLMYLIVIILFLIYLVFDIMWSPEAKTPFLNIIYFIKQLIYFIFIICISPFLGGMMSMGLIIFFSLFVIFFTNSYSDTYKEINEYTEKIRNDIKQEGFSKKLSFFDKIKNVINLLFDFIHKYVFQTAFLFMVIWSFYDYTHNIKSDNLKTSLLIINCILLFCIPLLTFVSYMSSFDINARKTFQEVHTPNIPENLRETIIPNIPINIPETIPNKIIPNLPTNVPQAITSNIPKSLQETLQQAVTSNIPKSLQETITSNIPTPLSINQTGDHKTATI